MVQTEINVWNRIFFGGRAKNIFQCIECGMRIREKIMISLECLAEVPGWIFM